MKTENTTQVFSAAGKLMLFGEYLVINGAKSLAFPLKFGQTLEINPLPESKILWEATSPDGLWFNCELNEKLEVVETNNDEATGLLARLLGECHRLRPELNVYNHFKINANFDLNWGLGSSSTFVSLLCQWAKMDPYKMLEISFGGSGYDIACATAKKPIVFERTPHYHYAQEIDLSNNVTDKFLFVYLGQKQNSRDEIKRFGKRSHTEADIEQMDAIVDKAVNSSTIEDFELLLNQSEDLLSPILGLEKLKDRIFADYKYSIKSLGAWGGDFFLATFRDLDKAKDYFKTKGFTTMFTYKELVK